MLFEFRSSICSFDQVESDRWRSDSHSLPWNTFAVFFIQKYILYHELYKFVLELGEFLYSSSLGNWFFLGRNVKESVSWY